VLAPYKLFLDDDRDPPDASWVVCRDNKSAEDCVKNHGWPQHVSFDYYLRGDTTEGFAQWLVARHYSGDTAPADFEYSLHSTSISGRMRVAKHLKCIHNTDATNDDMDWWLHRRES
jgi:hypothetical protein